MDDEELLKARLERYSEAYEELSQAFIKFSLASNDLTNQVREDHPTLFQH